MDAIYQAIEIAIKATGSSGLADLEAHAAALKAEIDRMAASMQALGYISQSDVKDLENLTRAHQDAARAVEIANDVIDRRANRTRQANSGADWAKQQKDDIDSLIASMGAYEQRADALTATELRNYQVVAAAASASHATVQRNSYDTTRATQAAARGFLDLSRGVEDFATGGWIGVLNNVPGVVTNIGIAMGATATSIAVATAGISLAATAAFSLYTNWEKVEDFFEMGVPRPILDTTEELKRKLDEATKITEELGKQTRLSVSEVNQYEKATEEVKRLNAELERQRDLKNLLSGQSKAERERASGFREAVAETGGTSARDTLDTAINQGADRRGLVFNEYTGTYTTPKELADRLLVEGAKGDVRARSEVTRFLDSAYRRQPGDFASNIAKFSPEGVAAQKAKESAEKTALEAQAVNERAVDAESKRQATQADQQSSEAQSLYRKDVAKGKKNAGEEKAEHDKAVREAVSRFGPGVDKGLTEAATQHAAMGMSPDQNYGSLFGQLKGNLARSGVDGAIIDKVTDAILRKVMDRIGNKIEAGVLAGNGNAQGVAGALAAGQDQGAMRGQAAHLKTLALQEQMMGVFGPNSVQYAQVEAMQRNLQARMRMLEGRPARNRRPPGRQAIRP